jgi:hypothetical protein
VSPDQNSIRILAVDDHHQFREGIAVPLSSSILLWAPREGRDDAMCY